MSKISLPDRTRIRSVTAVGMLLAAVSCGSRAGTKERVDLSVAKQEVLAREPCRAVFSDGKVVTFDYDADGRVLRWKYGDEEDYWENSWSNGFYISRKGQETLRYGQYGAYYLLDNKFTYSDGTAADPTYAEVYAWEMDASGAPVKKDAVSSSYLKWTCTYEHLDPEARPIPGLLWGEHGQSKEMCPKAMGRVVEYEYRGPDHGLSRVRMAHRDGRDVQEFDFVYKGCPVRQAGSARTTPGPTTTSGGEKNESAEVDTLEQDPTGDQYYNDDAEYVDESGLDELDPNLSEVLAADHPSRPTSGGTSWCLCYARRSDTGDLPVTACRATKDQCLDLEERSRTGTRDIVENSLTKSCRVVGSSVPSEVLGRAEDWQASSKKGGWVMNSACLLD